MFDLDDVSLLLIRDAATVPHHWLERWAVSYPLSYTVMVAADAGEEPWRAQISVALAAVGGERDGCCP